MAARQNSVAMIEAARSTQTGNAINRIAAAEIAPAEFTPAGPPGFEDLYFTSRDGLRLHARRYGERQTTLRPVVCLPGLTRNVRDFHGLALFLSAPGASARTVYTLDYRGRGSSQWDPNWQNYTPAVEAHDVLDFLTVAGLSDVAMIGTSRGGIIAMLIATLQPRALAALVLNDIGPVIEPLGLTRIAGFVGRMPLPASWAEATETVKVLNEPQFPKLTDAEWLAMAQALFDDLAGVPGPAYDPNLGKTLAGIARTGKVPDLWAQFAGLGRRPVLVLRGEHSDLLSVATVERMRERHPRLDAMTVRDQGHAPLLADRETQVAIRQFLDSCERA